MEEKIKQRLIGVLVIIGALFIILPFLFHNSRPTLSQQTPSTAVPAIAVALPAAATTPSTAATTSSTQQVAQAVPVTQATQPSSTTDVTSTTPTTVSTTSTQTDAVASTSTLPSTTQAATIPTTSVSSSGDTASTTSVSGTSGDTASNTPVTTTTANDSTIAAIKEQSPSTSTDEFSDASPAALTTGQANEGPTQNTLVTAEAVQQTVTAPAKPKQVVAKRQHHHVVRRAEQKGWVIQLGVFADHVNANHLIAKLHKRHFEAYAHSMRENNRTLVAVLVGPESNLHKTELLKRRLQTDFHLNGEIKKTV